ncbi:MAG: diacylglycerol kinase family lipid kinase [Bacteroidales bacterium]|nr:MAG: diacylglycerol kinase family lipid kinase [Bacteroidales bacterium]
MADRWYVIINPLAGSGKGRTDWPLIESLLKAKGIDFDFAFTTHKYHSVELTVNAINQGYKKLVAVGGDGTLNEMVNGVFIQKKCPTTEITIGVIAVGTGNDWSRMYKMHSTYEGKITAIKDEKIFLQDVGKVEYEESKVKQSRFFANAAGVGFDAEVARRTNRLKEHGHSGKVLYMGSLVRALFGYKPSFINIAIDGERLEGKIFSLTVGIGCFNGGGMMQLPNAVSDDGLLDVTVIRQIRRFEVIRNIYRLYNGTILSHPKISGHTGKMVAISSETPIGLEVDGESLGVSPFIFTVVPQSINVIVGADFHSVTSPATTVIDTE